jgi:hypothetical protein
MSSELAGGAAAADGDENRLCEASQTAKSCRIHRILDATIALLMVAILITLSLPVCMAVSEQRAFEQAQCEQPVPARLRASHADGPLLGAAGHS